MKINTLLAILVISIMILVSGCGKSSTAGQVVKENTEQPAETVEEQSEEAQTEETTSEQPAETITGGVTEPLTAETVPEEPQKIAIVEIRDQRFIPQDLSVSVGTTVIWEHRDESIKNMKHSITIYSEVQGKPFPYGGTFNHTFNRAGEFKYIDSIYKEYMPVGTISVHE